MSRHVVSSSTWAPAPENTSLGRWSRLIGGPVRQGVATLALVLVWQGLSTFVFSPYVLPSPIMVLSKSVELIVAGVIVKDIAISISRVVVGYGIGSIAGVVLGVMMGRLPLVAELVNPTFGFIRSIPPIAFVPLFIILFGIGEASKYLLISYVAFVVVAMHTATGVLETPRIRVQAAQTLGAGEFTILLRVMIPSAFPYMVAGLQLALSMSFMAVVSAELIASRSGIGYMIMDAQTMLETDRMVVGLLLLGGLGAVVDRGVNLLATTRLLRRFAPEQE